MQNGRNLFFHRCPQAGRTARAGPHAHKTLATILLQSVDQGPHIADEQVGGIDITGLYHLRSQSNIAC